MESAFLGQGLQGNFKSESLTHVFSGGGEVRIRMPAPSVTCETKI